MNQSVLNNTSLLDDACTQVINGEIITFIDGDVNIKCSGTCQVTNERTIVVKNGHINIESNISNL